MSQDPKACRYYLGGGGLAPALCNKPHGHLGPHARRDNLTREWVASQAPPAQSGGEKRLRRALFAEVPVERAPKESGEPIQWITAPKAPPDVWREFDRHSAELERGGN